MRHGVILSTFRISGRVDSTRVATRSLVRRLPALAQLVLVQAMPILAS